MWAPDYLSLDEAKTYLRVPTIDTIDDAYIASLITAASRAVDNVCRRQFGQGTATRRYPAERAAPMLDGSGWFLDVDDVADTTTATVTLDGVITAVLWLPRNAPADGIPYRAVLLPAQPTSDVVVFADPFGWPAVPARVPSAVRLQVGRWFARRESPLGVAGSPSEGSEVRLLARLDPDVSTMLMGLTRTRRTG